MATHPSERLANWVRESLLLPLAPLLLSAFFRCIGTRSPGPWWWCSEVPFFTLLMSAYATRVFEEIIVGVKTGQMKVSVGAFSAMKLVTQSVMLFGLLLMGAFYVDTHWVPFTAEMRWGAGRAQLLLALLALIAGFLAYNYEPGSS